MRQAARQLPRDGCVLRVVRHVGTQGSVLVRGSTTNKRGIAVAFQMGLPDEASLSSERRKREREKRGAVLTLAVLTSFGSRAHG